MKYFWPLILCLALVACAGAAPQAASTENPVEVTSPPAPVETAVAPRPDSQGATLTPTGPGGPCSSAELKLLAPMVMEISGQGGTQLTLVDLSNGLPSCGFEPLAMGRNNYLAVSPDGYRLAAVTSDSDTFVGGSLRLVDFFEQKVYPTSVEVDSWISDMVFSPDGSRLALAYQQEMPGLPVLGKTTSTLLVTSFEGQGQVARTALPFRVMLARFTRDGAALVVYGAPDTAPGGGYPTASVALLDASNLSRIWEQELEQVQHGYIPVEGNPAVEYLTEYLEPAVVYAPEQNSLYVVHAGEDELTRVDFTGRQVSTYAIRPRLAWTDRLLALLAEPAQAKAASGTRKQAVLSPDGRKLYVISTREDLDTDEAGNINPLRTPLGLQALDTASGEELGRYETTADQIHISPDGATLFLATWGWGNVAGMAEAVSTRDLSLQATFDDRVDQAFQITLSPGGKPHLLLLKYDSKETELTWLDWDSLQPVGNWKVGGYPILASMP